jgi:hypothetical protein
MGPSMCSLVSPEKENSWFFMFRESEKNLKATPGLSFYIILVSKAEKEINYHSKDALSNLLMSVKGSKITRKYFHV